MDSRFGEPIARGIALDVETIKADRKYPEKSGLKCVTVIEFEFNNQFVGGHTLITFEEETLSLLRSKLAKHEGPILGHNLFTFDYRALSSRIKLDGIVEKTVDLRAWFEERMFFEPDVPFAFNSLVKRNLESAIIPSTNQTNQLWLSNNKEQVFETNQNDCINLLTLWGKMIFTRELYVPLARHARKETTLRRLRVSNVDLDVLTGRHFLFDREGWDRSLKLPATDFSWAERIRSQPATIGCGANRIFRSYEAVRCRDGKKAAVFFVERYRSFDLNKRFRISKIAPGVMDVELIAESPPALIGYTDSECFSFPDLQSTTLYSGNSLECGRKLPPCVAKHIDSLENEIDDPALYKRF